MQPIQLCTMMQVVLSELSGQVARWLLKDSSPTQQQAEELGPIGWHISSNMLNVQLSANWLAQRAG